MARTSFIVTLSRKTFCLLNGTVKISDFGLAREIGPDATLRGETPDYWAPEQAVAVNTDCDGRADIYSFESSFTSCFRKRPQPNGARLPLMCLDICNPRLNVPRNGSEARFASVEEVRKR
jgi:serine/threonine protein kinase